MIWERILKTRSALRKLLFKLSSNPQTPLLLRHRMQQVAGLLTWARLISKRDWTQIYSQFSPKLTVRLMACEQLNLSLTTTHSLNLRWLISVIRRLRRDAILRHKTPKDLKTSNLGPLSSSTYLRTIFKSSKFKWWRSKKVSNRKLELLTGSYAQEKQLLKMVKWFLQTTLEMKDRTLTCLETRLSKTPRPLDLLRKMTITQSFPKQNF